MINESRKRKKIGGGQKRMYYLVELTLIKTKHKHGSMPKLCMTEMSKIRGSATLSRLVVID